MAPQRRRSYTMISSGPEIRNLLEEVTDPPKSLEKNAQSGADETRFAS